MVAATRRGLPPSLSIYREAMLDRRVLSYVRQHGLLPEGETAVVGVSGGPDSVCLLSVLVDLQTDLGIRLHVAHLDHGLRGEEAEEDARYVAALARRMGTPCTIERRDVTRYREERGLSLEEAAREVRYLFLADVAQAVGARRVAVGHTADDQVETLLMHLIRGTGLAGLRGMRPLTTLRLPDERQLELARPLLPMRRAETEACCQERDLQPRLDVTNVSPQFLRNRIRHELLPVLEQFNPAVRSALLRLAETTDDELDYLTREVGSAWRELATVGEQGVRLQGTPLRELHPALQRHVLRRAVREVAGDLADLTAANVESMRETLPKPAGTRIDLPHGVVFSVEYGTYRVSRGEPSLTLPPIEGELPLAVPGVTLLPGWRVRTKVCPRHEVDVRTGDPWRACLDFDRVGTQLVVRSRYPGDRFQPLGMEGIKRLQDFMVDARIPRRLRDRVPVVTSREQIVWVAGWRIDERVRVTPGTQAVLCLQFDKLDKEHESHDDQPQ